MIVCVSFPHLSTAISHRQSHHSSLFTPTDEAPAQHACSQHIRAMCSASHTDTRGTYKGQLYSPVTTEDEQAQRETSEIIRHPSSFLDVEQPVVEGAADEGESDSHWTPEGSLQAHMPSPSASSLLAPSHSTASGSSMGKGE